MSVCVRERECVCVCVCMCVRESGVCVCERERGGGRRQTDRDTERVCGPDAEGSWMFVSTALVA